MKGGCIGGCIVTASEDGTAKVWTYDDREVEWNATCGSGETESVQWEGHEAGITSMSVCPTDPRLFLTASKDATAKIWNIDGALKTTLRAHEVSSKRSTKGGHQERVASQTVGHTDFLNTAVWSKKPGDAGTLVVTSSDDKTACVWDAEKGRVVETLAEHTGSVCGAEWNNGMGVQLILTCSHDGTCIAWDKHYKAQRTFPGTQRKEEEGHTGPVWSAHFSTDDEMILTASQDGTARVFDVRSGRLKNVLKDHDDAVLHAAFNPQDDNQVLTCSMDNTARLWDLRADTSHATMVFNHHKACVWTASFGSNPQHVLTASHDMTALIYDQRLQLPKNALGGHTGLLWEASFSPDDSWVVTCSEDTTARIWNLRTGARRPPCHILRKSSEGHSDTVTCAAWLPLGVRTA